MPPPGTQGLSRPGLWGRADQVSPREFGKQPPLSGPPWLVNGNSGVPSLPPMCSLSGMMSVGLSAQGLLVTSRRPLSCLRSYSPGLGRRLPPLPLAHLSRVPWTAVAALALGPSEPSRCSLHSGLPLSQPVPPISVMTATIREHLQPAGPCPEQCLGGLCVPLGYFVMVAFCR